MTALVETVHAGELGRGRMLARTGAVRLITWDARARERVDVDARAGADGEAIARAVACVRAGAERVVVRVGVGNDFLMQVARLRAFRLVWARLVELGAGAELVLWAEPSAWSWTVYDPWVNLLRNTAGCFAAIVGGADWVTPLPYDAALGTSDALARRLAENTVHVLLHEGHLGVEDAAAGSFAIEAWTDGLAAEMWDGLRRAEAGDVAGAGSGEREARVARRLDGIIGTSLYANPGESLPVRDGAVELGARAAEPFEKLRAVGPRASVFIAALGALADHSVRLGWTRGLYEVAGMRVSARAVADPDAAVLAWRASGAPVAVLCGSDALYGEAGASYVAALKDAGARVVLAGRPKGVELAVDDKVYAGMDVVAALGKELAAQGVVA